MKIVMIVCVGIAIITFILGDLLENKYKIKSPTLFYLLGLVPFITYCITMGILFLIKEL